jgi:hypothetical protein
MIRGIAKAPPPKPFTLRQRLREIDMFFQRRDQVHKSMRRLANRLAKADIVYAIMGGMAVNAHKYQRTTRDVDVLLTPQGFEEFCRRFVPKSYARVPGRARRFIDQANEIFLDVLITGRYPGRGIPGPIAFPDPAEVAETIEKFDFVDLLTLVQLKLAARRHRDFGDVVELIRFNNLDESFAEGLHPSIRRDYIECLEEKKREDEYEAREG